MSETATVGSASGQTQADQTVERLRRIALDALARMFRPDRGLHAFRLRRTSGDPALEGESIRYTATVLIGLASESAQTAGCVLSGLSPDIVGDRLVDRLDSMRDLGEVALTLWAIRALGHDGAGRVLSRLRALDPARADVPTVELAWSLTALTFEGHAPTDAGLARAVADRLVASFNHRSNLFPHRPVGSHASGLRGHVSCFADLVYPIQALSHFHRFSGDKAALETATACAKRMGELQGPAGQWWWHYDVRTGRVVERYPVYAVHQDAMAPMALFACAAVSGEDFRPAIRRSLQWLTAPAEMAESLIDERAAVIWRKVARREPGRLVRAAQAGLSRMHPRLRLPAPDLLFPPIRIDYESRPYHMGWILHAWPPGRTI